MHMVGLLDQVCVESVCTAILFGSSAHRKQNFMYI